MDEKRKVGEKKRGKERRRERKREKMREAGSLKIKGAKSLGFQSLPTFLLQLSSPPPPFTNHHHHHVGQGTDISYFQLYPIFNC